MVNFVATTRRRCDRGNPRDAGEATPAKESLDFSYTKWRSLCDAPFTVSKKQD